MRFGLVLITDSAGFGLGFFQQAVPVHCRFVVLKPWIHRQYEEAAF